MSMNASEMLKEFAEFLNEGDDSGIQLAQFLQERNGAKNLAPRIFNNFESEPFSLSVHLEKGTTLRPESSSVESKVKVQAMDPASISISRQSRVRDNQKDNNQLRYSSSARTRSSMRRTPADHLRRASLKRYSSLNARRRVLLPEFDNTTLGSSFSPGVSSTPMVSIALGGLVPRTPPKSEQVSELDSNTNIHESPKGRENQNDAVKPPQNEHNSVSHSAPGSSQLTVVIVPISQTVSQPDERQHGSIGTGCAENTVAKPNATMEQKAALNTAADTASIQIPTSATDVPSQLNADVSKDPAKNTELREPPLLQLEAMATEDDVMTDDEDIGDKGTFTVSQPHEAMATEDSAMTDDDGIGDKGTFTVSQSHESDRGVALNLGRSKRFSLRVRRAAPLNKAPSTPINGERFAAEIKSQLARLTNMEILDLRKRNSMGRVYMTPSPRLKAQPQERLNKQSQLEKEIALELQERNVCNEVDALIADRSADVENIPAPPGFGDDTVLQPADLERLPSYTDIIDNYSLVGEKDCDRVTLLPRLNNRTTSSTAAQKKKKSAKMAESVKSYLEVTQAIRDRSRRRRSGLTKRSLYSKGQSDTEETSVNCFADQSVQQPGNRTPNSKAPVATPTSTTRSRQRQSSVPNKRHSILEVSLPPPEAFANTSRSAKKSPAVPACSNTLVITTLDENTFKKPRTPPKKTQARSVEKRMEVSPAHTETSIATLRRSKRGHVPRKNNWTYRTTNPMSLYTVMYMDQFMKRYETDKRKKCRTNSYADLVTLIENGVQDPDPAVRADPKAKPKANRTKKSVTTTGGRDVSARSVATLRSLSPVVETIGDTDEVEVPAKLPKLTKKTDKSTRQKQQSKSITVETKKKKLASDKKTKNQKAKAAKVTSAVNGSGMSVHESPRKATNPLNRKKITRTKATPNKSKARGKSTLDNSSAITAAPVEHINNLFDKNLEMNLQQTPTSHGIKAVCVRLRRTPLLRSQSIREAQQAAGTHITSNADPLAAPDSTASTSGSSQANLELLSWLKCIPNLNNGLHDGQIFQEMHCSARNNLTFSDLDGVDCAFYKSSNAVEYGLGYLRFKPLQSKPPRRSKTYNLQYVVLTGDYIICTNNETGHFNVGDMIEIKKGVRYSIQNTSNATGLLMVVKK